MGVGTILGGFLPGIDLRKGLSRGLRQPENVRRSQASVDEDVHATADREVGVTPRRRYFSGQRCFPKDIMRSWGLILRKEIAG